MVEIINDVADLILERVEGIQIGIDKQKVAVGDIEGLVLIQIRRIESGVFGKAEIGAKYSIVVELFTRNIDYKRWYEMAERILKAINGEKIEPWLTPLDFRSLAFFGLRENLFFGEIVFETKSYGGEI